MKVIILFLVIWLSSCNQSHKGTHHFVAGTVDAAEVQTDSVSTADKKENGQADFKASGTEPFWSLQIDFEKGMHFKTADGYQISTPAVAGVKAMDAPVTRYAAVTEKGSLTVQLQKRECTNDMSGKKSAYTVTVDTKYTTDKNLRTYKGCGGYMADYRLHDLWVLDSINNKKIAAPGFAKGAPLLELNLTENRFMGHSSCNDITGALEVQGKKISFGRLVATRKVCNSIAFENAYQGALNGKTIAYRLYNRRLYLQVSTDSLFVYKKVD